MSEPFFTIGHSNRTTGEFIELLRGQAVELVVDVRTIPRSRANPQFNGDALPASLAAQGIGYERLAGLGGLRGRREGGPSPNGFWENGSFRNYADYAMTGPFREALAALRALGHERRCAIMCAEAVWWRCHRRIIADYLIQAGEEVRHILGPGDAKEASLTPGSRPRPDGTILYPAGGAAAPSGDRTCGVRVGGPR